jgi:hypothetical protein
MKFSGEKWDEASKKLNLAAMFEKCWTAKSFYLLAR